MAKVFNPAGEELSPAEIAAWANNVHLLAGGRKSPFTARNYMLPDVCNKRWVDGEFRLGGAMCDCGCDKDIPGNPSLGEFVLSPMDSEEVKDGLKAYMRCRKCGAWTHL